MFLHICRLKVTMNFKVLQSINMLFELTRLFEFENVASFMGHPVVWLIHHALVQVWTLHMRSKVPVSV